MRKYIPLTDDLYDYMRSVSVHEDDLLRRLTAETAKTGDIDMPIAPEQGAFLALLVKMIDARRTIEIGTYMGYSALVTARALPDDGAIIACDIDADVTQTARRYWEEAGVAHKIDLRLAPATDTLAQLIADGESGTFDFAFIDANKDESETYFEQCFTLLRPGGVMVFDNSLRRGTILQADSDDPYIAALRAVNEKAHTDERVESVLLPFADGMLIVRKR